MNRWENEWMTIQQSWMTMSGQNPWKKANEPISASLPLGIFLLGYRLCPLSLDQIPKSSFMIWVPYMLYNFWIDLSGKLLDRKLGLTESDPRERKWIRIRSVLNYASNQATQCRKLLKLLALKLALKNWCWIYSKVRTVNK